MTTENNHKQILSCVVRVDSRKDLGSVLCCLILEKRLRRRKISRKKINSQFHLTIFVIVSAELKKSSSLPKPSEGEIKELSWIIFGSASSVLWNIEVESPIFVHQRRHTTTKRSFRVRKK